MDKQSDLAIKGPGVIEIPLYQKQFFSPLSEFFLYAYIGNKRNTPKMDKIVSPLRSVIAGFNCIYTLSHELRSKQSANERRSEHSGARERSEQCRANLGVIKNVA